MPALDSARAAKVSLALLPAIMYMFISDALGLSLDHAMLALILLWAGAMDAAFAETAQECSVPADFASTVLGGFTVATFARVASTQEACESVFRELLVEGHLDSSPASERIQALASLRLLLN